MRMRIHETRRERSVAEVDHLRAARDRQVASCIDNLIALHDNDTVLHERVRFAVEESRRFERNGLIGGVGCNCENEKRKETIKSSHAADLERIGSGGKKERPCLDWAA